MDQPRPLSPAFRRTLHRRHVTHRVYHPTTLWDHLRHWVSAATRGFRRIQKRINAASPPD